MRLVPVSLRIWSLSSREMFRLTPCFRLIGVTLAIGFAAITEATGETITLHTAASDTVPLAIVDDGYDGSLGSMASKPITLNVGPNLEVVDVDVVVRINHNFVGDLTIKLVGPGGTGVTLLNRPGLPGNLDDGSEVGGDSSNLRDTAPILFDDTAPSGVPSESMGLGLSSATVVGSGPTAGPDNYLPHVEGDPLSLFEDSDPNGLWTLYVGDSSAAAAGTFVAWELRVSTHVIPEPTTLGLMALACGWVVPRRRAWRSDAR